MISKITDKQNLVYRKTYTAKYTIGEDSRVTLTGADFGITIPLGYKVAGVYRVYSGNSKISVRGVYPTRGSGNIMYIYNKSGSGVSGTFTASISLIYVKDSSFKVLTPILDQ